MHGPRLCFLTGRDHRFRCGADHVLKSPGDGKSRLSPGEIQKKYAPSLPEVWIDRNQIVQIFLNLLTNSVQSMEKGGRLTLSTRQRDGWVEIHFQDSGKGISEENLSRIFDPFFTTKENGTGLGLSISKRIIEDHGGNISIESQVHQGTWVTIQLPARLKLPHADKDEGR